METWVLIFWLIAGNYGGPATAEFSSLVRCEEAAAAVRERALKRGALSSYMIDHIHVCVRK